MLCSRCWVSGEMVMRVCADESKGLYRGAGTRMIVQRQSKEVNGQMS